MFFASVSHVESDCCWQMVGSDVKLSYAAIPHLIRGYHRLRWPLLILFVPEKSMKKCGQFALDDYDLLFHVEGTGNLYVELAVAGNRRMSIPSYDVLARILHRLLVQGRYAVANISCLNMRLVKPKLRRASLVCFKSEDEQEDESVARNMLFLGADGGMEAASAVCVVSTVPVK